jgi:Fe-S-cluster-containing dehydrogenase component
MSDEHKILHIDYSKCIGCETCESVCKFANDTPRIHMTRTRAGVMAPLYCHHCDKPNCALVCKRGAIRRDRDGAVILQTLLCRGCQTKSCLVACPFAAIFETDKGVMLAKCDLCAGRRQLGLGPACVDMCPCGAISHVSRETAEAGETEESRAAFARVLEHIKPSGPSGK